MPIPRDLILGLIKQAEHTKLPKWKTDYFKKIAKALQVHTKGQLFTKVDSLFPNEHPDSKDHCLATYEPITQSSIWKGINNLKRIFAHSSVSYEVSPELRDWLMDYRFQGQNLFNHFLDAWVAKAVAEDPNGIFVVYPPDWAAERNICPIQFVRSELIQAINPEAVAFISEDDSEIEYRYEAQTCHRVVYNDVKIGRANSKTFTQTTYNQRLEVKVKKAVVHVMTREGLLIYTRVKGDEFNWEVVDFPETMSALPVFPGGGDVADEADQLLFNSFVGPFIPFGNLALLQHRNHRAVDLQFSYPRMSELQTPCEYKGCVGGIVQCPVTEATPSGYKPCPGGCSGGWVTVQSPYRTYNPRYDPGDEGKNEHLKVDPVKFFSPDVGIIEYSKDAWKNYLRMAEEAIFIQQKVQTGNVQSAESKGYDFEELYAWLTTISKRFYSNVRTALQALEEYMSPNPATVSVEQPYSFAILTEEEAFLALTNILGSNAPVFIKADRVDNFLSKFVSKDSPVARAVGILKRVDLLLYYSTNEIQTYKAQNAITQEQVSRHVLAFPVLMGMYQADKTLFEANTDDQLVVELNKQLPIVMPSAPGTDFRTAIQTQLSEGGTAA